MTGHVLDVGAGQSPDPRADTTLDRHADADVQADLTEAWPFRDGAFRGVVASHVVEHLPDPMHFFREAGRVLRPGGWLEVTVPLGRDARADPDHQHEWTYWTPRMFCQQHRQESGRHWDPKTSFLLVDRRLDVRLLGPLARLSGVYNRLADRWPAWAAHRCGTGELTARYRRAEP